MRRAPRSSEPGVSTVYPDEKPARPVLYGPKGEPLYREPEPFGYRLIDDERTSG